MKIALYLGGTSMERDVSVISGRNIGAALQEAGHEVLYADPALPPETIGTDPDQQGLIGEQPPGDQEVARLDHTRIFRLLLDKRIASCDFHFIGLHGGIGENGVLQGMMEHLGYRFNGPGYSASAVAMDKHLSKEIMVAQAVPTPEWLVVTRTQWSDEPGEVRQAIGKTFHLPVVIKPNAQGSTIGLSVIREKSALNTALDKAFQYDHRVLVEQYVPGSEITAAILGEDPLPLIRIRPKSGLYDYESKYSEGRTEYEVPAQLQDALTDQIQMYALRLFRSIGARGYSRVDFRLTDAGEPLCLEINTLPGMTTTSLVPKAAGAAGISFAGLLERIIQLGGDG